MHICQYLYVQLKYGKNIFLFPEEALSIIKLEWLIYILSHYIAVIVLVLPLSFSFSVNAVT